ncbi:hypothetical protein [Pandoraea sp. NPDC087047]|uniref:hypothetical protein n=1 Tax=Pandoraea sp. NPDC087047 TaxID=3364390 RepID=UPI003821EF3A
MYLSLGEWLTAALAFTNGLTPPDMYVHEMSTTLTRVTSVPIHDNAITIPPQDLASSHTHTAFDWSRPPVTRARVFAERLTDVRPVCVVGSRDDRENCLLDLPADARTHVSASRLMLSGCESSLPAPLRALLTQEGRNASALERTFSETFAAESRGQFSVSALERRLTERLRELSPAMRRLVSRTDAYIEIPQLTFFRLITSEREARRHGIRVPSPDPNLRLHSGDPEVRDAMLGAYIRIPFQGWTHTVLVSLASPLTIEPIRQNSRAHAKAHRHQMFGDVPEYFETTNLRMRAIPRGENLMRTLAEHLHEGHQHYREFAYGATREMLTLTPHSHIRQRACQAFPRDRPPVVTRESVPRGLPAQAAAAPAAPTRGASGQINAPTASEMAQALAELERLDQHYRSQSRPRFG